MTKILYFANQCSHQSDWTVRLASLPVQVDIMLDHTDWENRCPSEKYAMAIVPILADDLEMERQIRRLRKHASFVLGITSGVDRDLQRAAYACGIDDCVDDQCGDAELQSKIERAARLHWIDKSFLQSQKLQSIGELASGIAHEINTPIQYVGDNTRFIREACEDIVEVLDACREVVEHLETGNDPSRAVVELREMMNRADIPYLKGEMPEALKQTLDGIERVSAIVRAIKTFAHPTVGEATPTNLNDLIQTTITLSRNEWKYDAEIETDLDATLESVPCIAGEIHQVLLNLIVNAAHAISESTPDRPKRKGLIQIRTRRDQEHVEIVIEDSGVGIPDRQKTQVFEPFFTSKPAGKGTGQGLAIAKKIVTEHHGGSIWFESKVGEGTSFFVQLPMQAAEVSAEPVEGGIAQ